MSSSRLARAAAKGASLRIGDALMVVEDARAQWVGSGHRKADKHTQDGAAAVVKNRSNEAMR